MSIKRANASSVTKSGSAISDVPDAPTGLTATDSGDGTTASVSFTPAVTGGTATSYTVTSSPGGFTGTGASSPISVTGLTAGTAYTFTATATNSSGTSSASTASGSLTLASVGSYFLIQRTTVGAGGTSTITFSSIPQTYTHLQLRGIGRTDRSAQQADIVRLRFNSDSGTNYVSHNFEGNGSSIGLDYATSTASPWSGIVTAASATSGNFGGVIIDVLDYTNTSKYTTLKSLSAFDNNDTNGRIYFSGNLWQNTAAITRIDVQPIYGTNWVQYTTFALYGIKGA